MLINVMLIKRKKHVTVKVPLARVSTGLQTYFDVKKIFCS